MFRERTYSPENKEKLESAISKIDNGKSEKPELFYAISHLRGEKYQIVTLGVDGTKDVVQGNLSKQQAIDKMNQIFVEKQDTANVQIISPEELDKISVDIFQHQTEEERKPDKLFKVLENPNKQAAEKLSHYVQELKLVGEDYVAVGVAKVGTYDECSKAAEKLMKDNNPTYRIYQVKEGDEGRYIRFENIASLTKRGLKPDFSKYEQVYEAPLSEVEKVSDSRSEQLEYLFQKFNTGSRPDGYTGVSMSVSDVVVLDKTPYFVDSIGFKELRNFTPEQKLETIIGELEKTLKEKISQKEENTEKTAEPPKKSKAMKF